MPAIDALASEALDRLEDSDRCGTWTCELDEEYRAGSWSRGRRVVQILVERPGELFPRSFWLITSLPDRRDVRRGAARDVPAAR